jgi:hypothetical protein
MKEINLLPLGLGEQIDFHYLIINLGMYTDIHFIFLKKQPHICNESEFTIHSQYRE